MWHVWCLAIVGDRGWSIRPVLFYCALTLLWLMFDDQNGMKMKRQRWKSIEKILCPLLLLLTSHSLSRNIRVIDSAVNVNTSNCHPNAYNLVLHTPSPPPPPLSFVKLQKKIVVSDDLPPLTKQSTNLIVNFVTFTSNTPIHLYYFVHKYSSPFSC